jgi:alpha-amylase
MTARVARSQRSGRLRDLGRAAICALAMLAACGGGGGSSSGGTSLLPPLDPTYRASGKASAGDVFVHLFEWRWADIARECETFLRPVGYAAVQISPPSEHAVITGGVAYPWWQRYQTVSYKLDQSRSGTLADFRDMVSRCNTAGVKIYADAVINHMTAGSGVGSAGSSYTKTDYAAVPWSAGDFHPGCGVNNYANAANVQLCELVGLADLRTEDDAVRSRIAAYLIALHAEGVAGFRIDAAKHMQPRDIDAIVSQVNAAALAAGRTRPYFFLEVINNAGEAVTAQQYFGVGYASGGASDVTDFQYGYRITDAFTGRGGATLASLQTLANGLLPSDKGVVFVDNHDNQRGDNLYYASTVGGVPVYDLATVFMLAHPHGAPSVMSSYGFDRGTQAGRDAGPPSTTPGVTDSTFDAGGTRCTRTPGIAQVGDWICEHRLGAIASMVAFRKATVGAPLSGCGRSDWLISADPNRIAFCRDGKGFVALSRSAVQSSLTLPTTLPDGSYCNIARFTYQPANGAVAANCSGPPVSITAGSALINLPANGAVALHIGAKL